MCSGKNLLSWFVTAQFFKKKNSNKAVPNLKVISVGNLTVAVPVKVLSWSSWLKFWVRIDVHYFTSYGAVAAVKKIFWLVMVQKFFALRMFAATSLTCLRKLYMFRLLWARSIQVLFVVTKLRYM